MEQFKRTKQYSVEATVIVASILLAFVIDAGWENRQQAIAEIAVLESIKSDMQSNLDEIKRIIEINSNRQLNISSIFALDPDMEEQDSRWYSSPTINSLWGLGTFNSFSGSLSERNLSLIEDLNLRNLLGTWLGLATDSMEGNELQVQAVFNLQRIAADSDVFHLIGNQTGGLPAAPHIEVLERGPVVRRLRRNETFTTELLRWNFSMSVQERKINALYEATVDTIEQLNNATLRN